MDLLANPAVCCVTIEPIKTARYYMFIVMNNTLFIAFEELTDTGSNVHDLPVCSTPYCGVPTSSLQLLDKSSKHDQEFH